MKLQSNSTGAGVKKLINKGSLMRFYRVFCWNSQRIGLFDNFSTKTLRTAPQGLTLRSDSPR
jgi:hypothetical protein